MAANLYLDREAFPEAFAADVDPETARVMAATQRLWSGAGAGYALGPAGVAVMDVRKPTGLRGVARCGCQTRHCGKDALTAPGLETVSHFAAGAPLLEFGVGVLPIDRHQPSQIAAEIDRLGLDPPSSGSDGSRSAALADRNHPAGGR
jgi:hypothetical protein